MNKRSQKLSPPPSLSLILVPTEFVGRAGKTGLFSKEIVFDTYSCQTLPQSKEDILCDATHQTDFLFLLLKRSQEVWWLAL